MRAALERHDQILYLIRCRDYEGARVALFGPESKPTTEHDTRWAIVASSNAVVKPPSADLDT